MSSANRRRREQNREARVQAAEDARRRAKRQRITLTAVGLALAIGVAVVLVARAHGNNGSSASKASTSTTSGPSTTAGPTTTTTVPGSVAGKPCVAMKGTPPVGAPAVPVVVGPPPKQLVTRDLRVGTGAVVKANATVTIDYIGVSCSSGKIFDSSYSRHQPFVTPLSQVVPGWQQGIPGMKVGGERLLGIPPALAYGSQGYPPDIAPDETLWFVVNLLKTA